MNFKKLASILLFAAASITSFAAKADIILENQSGQIRANSPDMQLTPTFLTVNWSDASPDAGLVNFDLSAYAGQTASNATANFYHQWNSAPGATFGLYRNLSSWAGATLTWNNAPAYDLTPVATLSINDDNQGVWRSFDLTSTVNGWLSGDYANYGLRLQRIDQPNSVAYFKGAFDDEYRPRVELTLAPVPEPETYALMALGLIGIGLARRKNV